MTYTVNSRKLLEKRIGELTRRYALTHDPNVKAETEELNRRMAALRVLEDALNRSRGEDVWTPEVFSALDCLAANLKKM